jgi:hypothetical protein
MARTGCSGAGDRVYGWVQGFQRPERLSREIGTRFMELCEEEVVTHNEDGRRDA